MIKGHLCLIIVVLLAFKLIISVVVPSVLYSELFDVSCAVSQGRVFFPFFSCISFSSFGATVPHFCQIFFDKFFLSEILILNISFTNVSDT